MTKGEKIGGSLTDAYSFRTGLIRSQDTGYLLGFDDKRVDDLPHSILFVLKNNQWASKPFNWAAHAMVLTYFPEPTLIMIGKSKKVMIGKVDGFTEEDIPFVSDDADLRGIAEINGYAYICGMFGQVYKREAARKWIKKNKGLPLDGADTADLESIHGFSETDIYAVGWEGCIWHYDGKCWNAVKSPTTFVLTRVLCAPDGYVYACGLGGVLLKGKDKKFGIIHQDITEADFWSLVFFKDEIYVSTSSFLYKLKNDVLKLVHFDEDAPDTCYHLSVADGLMWSIGSKDVMCFNGKKWKRVE